jgi:HK97 family phage portal protein
MGIRRLFGLEERAAIGARIHTATDGRDMLLNDPDGWEVEQPWLWWSGPAGGDGTGGPWGNPPPGADFGDGMANLPAVTRCTALIVDTLAGLPWNVYAGYDKQETPLWIRDPQQLRTDGRSGTDSTGRDDLLSGVEFWANWITAALWHGDGYVYVPMREGETTYVAQRDRTKALPPPKGPLWQIHPSEIVIEDGRYFLRETGWEFRYGDLIHLRGEPPYAHGHGRGVLDAHGVDLGLAWAVRQYAAGTFGAGIPSGYLKVTAPNPTQEQVDQLKSKWMAQHGGARRSIAVLNATTEFHPISISPIDAQLDSARTWSLRDIALAFGLPPYMLGVPGDSSTYANVESRMTELRTFTLLPWARRIEATLDAQLPGTTSVKLDLDATLRADTSTRWAAYSTALADGWLTKDEVRALEDRPPLPADAQTGEGESV